MVDTIITADSLVKAYGEVKALDGLSLTIERGIIYGLLGPNGAGKPPSSGSFPPCSVLMRAPRGLPGSTFTAIRPTFVNASGLQVSTPPLTTT